MKMYGCTCSDLCAYVLHRSPAEEKKWRCISCCCCCCVSSSVVLLLSGAWAQSHGIWWNRKPELEFSIHSLSLSSVAQHIRPTYCMNVPTLLLRPEDLDIRVIVIIRGHLTQNRLTLLHNPQSHGDQCIAQMASQRITMPYQIIITVHVECWQKKLPLPDACWEVGRG